MLPVYVLTPDNTWVPVPSFVTFAIPDPVLSAITPLKVAVPEEFPFPFTLVLFTPILIPESQPLSPDIRVPDPVKAST